MKASFSHFSLTKSVLNSIGEEECFVLQTCALGGFIATSSSNNVIKIFDVDNLNFRGSLTAHGASVTDLKRFGSDSTSLVTSSEDGNAIVWDLRSFEPSATLRPGSSVYSVAVNQDASIVACAGSSHISLFDMRTGKMFGRIEDAHMDEITQLYFHPFQRNVVVSGSLDGLICAFDTLNLDEEECLLSTCNVEDSISKIGFFGLRGEYMYCMTGTERFSMWNFLDSERIKTWDDPRSSLMEASGGAMKVDYLVDGHFQESEGRLFLFAGSFDGNIVLAEVHREFLQPISQLSGGHSAMVRSVSVPDMMMPDRLFTGGEDSRLCAWKFSSREESIHVGLEQIGSSSVGLGRRGDDGDEEYDVEEKEKEEARGGMVVESGRQRRGERRHVPFAKMSRHRTER
eukprot:TRINITY_DN1888_c0_g1_i2.p2 TRINITY_DN1888_c0_g1~~TRINITY_DN1888_c0_g1_i2.p2  ORF type:complete len:440 (+),score=116.76 TRINITY_DN1888_c0_g1_i2:122-1321(+)